MQPGPRAKHKCRSPRQLAEGVAPQDGPRKLRGGTRKTVAGRAEQERLEAEEQQASLDASMARRLQEQDAAALAQQPSQTHSLGGRSSPVGLAERASFPVDQELGESLPPWELPVPRRQASGRGSSRHWHDSGSSWTRDPMTWTRHPSSIPAPAMHHPRAGIPRRRGWLPAPTLTHTVMAMLAENGALDDGSSTERLGMRESFQAVLAAHPQLAALREAFASAGSTRLPPHLLFSDRDFDENDYEALLALDDSVKSRKGATAEAIAAIPVRVVGAAEIIDADCKCPICLEDFAPGATLRDLPCGHQYHQACLDQWLQQKATCPICQRSYQS